MLLARLQPAHRHILSTLILTTSPRHVSPIVFVSRIRINMSNAAAPPPPQRRFQRPVIFVCDIQEKFRDTIWNFDKILLTTAKVLRAAHLLALPVHVTTQNAARLGATVPELAALLDPSAPPAHQPGARLHPSVDKTRFSMWVPDVIRRLDPSGPSEVILVGIESHICVTQTALDLLANGHRVYVLADGVSSANREEVGIALARLRAEGATVTTSESVIYELMGDARAPEFRGVVGLVKDTLADTRKALQALL